MIAPGGAAAYEFGPFRLDVGRRALYRGQTQLALTSKSFDVLAVLVEHAGSAVDKSTLLATVWCGVAVEENSVAKAVSDVRRALGEGTQDPRFVATLPGHGYRFIAPVTRVGETGRPRRVAVLPFSALTPSDGEEYLPVGLADSLITRLSRLRNVIVRPTRAILRFAGGDHDAMTAGRQLDVDCVLDGTIRRAGDRVRVTAQLVDVSSGAVSWGDTFDETVIGMFTLEDVIAERVAFALAPVVTTDERHPLKRPHPTDPEAYRWYLKGRFRLAKRTVADCWEAIAAFERVIATNPDDALAYSGIADAYVFLGVQAIVMGGIAPAETFPRAKAAIAHALRIDDRLAEAHTAQAHVSFLYDWDRPTAEHAHRQSLVLDPHSASAHHGYGLMQSFLGRHDAALAEMELALQLDPLSPIISTNLGRVLFHARQDDAAATQLEAAVALHPHFVVARYRLGLAFEALGRYDDAIREFRIAQELSHDAPLPAAALAGTFALAGRRADADALLAALLQAATSSYVAAPGIAEIYLASRQDDRAFEWLERAIHERSSMLVTLLVNPRYDRVRDDPRFKRLVERVGLWDGGRDPA